MIRKRSYRRRAAVTRGSALVDPAHRGHLSCGTEGKHLGGEDSASALRVLEEPGIQRREHTAMTDHED